MSVVSSFFLVVHHALQAMSNNGTTSLAKRTRNPPRQRTRSPAEAISVSVEVEVGVVVAVQLEPVSLLVLVAALLVRLPTATLLALPRLLLLLLPQFKSTKIRLRRPRFSQNQLAVRTATGQNLLPTMPPGALPMALLPQFLKNSLQKQLPSPQNYHGLK